MPEAPKFEVRPAHWLFGLLILVGLIMFSRHFMDAGELVELLHVYGVSLEAALACTLLLRGFTFWFPMLPGLWLAPRELA